MAAIVKNSIKRHIPALVIVCVQAFQFTGASKQPGRAFFLD